MQRPEVHSSSPVFKLHTKLSSKHQAENGPVKSELGWYYNCPLFLMVRTIFVLYVKKTQTASIWLCLYSHTRVYMDIN